ALTRLGAVRKDRLTGPWLLLRLTCPADSPLAATEPWLVLPVIDPEITLSLRSPSAVRAVIWPAKSVRVILPWLAVAVTWPVSRVIVTLPWAVVARASPVRPEREIPPRSDCARTGSPAGTLS